MTHAIDITANIAKYQGFFLYTERADILSQDPVKSQSREIGCYNNDRIALTFDRHIGSIAAEVPVKCQSDWKSLNINREASRLDEILR